MANSEIIKLAILICAAVLIGGGGQLMINRKRKAKKLAEEGYSDSSGGASENEEIAKNYIEQYKAEYPRESLKSGLLGQGISDSEAEDYLNRYL